jgi:hypothetical protein
VALHWGGVLSFCGTPNGMTAELVAVPNAESLTISTMMPDLMILPWAWKKERRKWMDVKTIRCRDLATSALKPLNLR